MLDTSLAEDPGAPTVLLRRLVARYSSDYKTPRAGVGDKPCCG